MSGFLSAILCLALATPAYSSGVPSPNSLESSVHLLRQNDLNFTDAPNHASMMVIEPTSFNEAVEKCNALHETLLNIDAAPKFSTDLVSLLSYIEFRGDYPPGQAYWIGGKNSKQPTTVQLINNRLVEESVLALPILSSLLRYPALCSQSAPFRPSSESDKSPNFQVSVTSGQTTYIGFRDQLSFRFLGIKYANPFERWEHSSVIDTKKAVTHVNATNFGDQCFQVGGGPFSEDCLFLNVYTPILPSSNTRLRPVLFWIHGGAFTGGTGADPTFEPGPMVSRGDVVVVTINYRLTTLGFLSLNDGIVTGNYGLNDQITALHWVQQNIAAFGGDPKRVTIFGQSAGASSCRALIASPLARGLFAAALPMSNLIGDGFSAQFSNYPTPAQELQLAGNAVIQEAGCANSSDLVACLKAVPAQTLVNLPAEARFIVVDDIVLFSDQLLLNHTGIVNSVPTMWGHMMFDGAAFIGFPSVGESLQSALNSIVGSQSAAAVVSRSDLFPIPHTSNTTLDTFNVTARAATDVMFRCLDQATAVAGVKNNLLPNLFFYVFARSYQTPGFDPNAPVCDAPKTPSHPLGDPDLPYFQCHSGELFYVFASLNQFGLLFRDDNDILMTQVTMDYWLSYAWNHNPNPPEDMLAARGYTTTLAVVKELGTWEPVNAENPTLRVLDFPVQKSNSQVPFVDQSQCTFLGFPLNSLE